MSTSTRQGFVKDAWQTPRNARTLQAFVALQNNEIAERITHLRERRGNPPQEVVARKLGVSHRTYQSWEGAEAKPSYANLESLAEFFGVTEDYILTGTETGLPRDTAGEQLDRIEANQQEMLAILRELADGGYPKPPGELGRRAANPQTSKPSSPQARKKRAADGPPSNAG